VEPAQLPPPSGGIPPRFVQIIGAGSETPVSGTLDERISTIAGAQRGRVSRRQLLAAGIASNTIDRLVRSGRLRRVHRGVFAVGHDAPVPLDDETAALLAVRGGAALSHHTAARLWSLLSANDTEGPALPIHVIVAGGSLHDHPGIAIHRTQLLRPGDIRVRDHLLVTSPARTLLDLAALLPSRDLERALDQAIIQTLTTRAAVCELLARSGRHRGRKPLQGLVDGYTHTTFTRSEAEELFLARVREADLPIPLTNVKRHGVEIDFLWPEQNVAVEIDGFAYHKSRRAFEADRRRDARLSAAGITVIRITWRQLRYDPMAAMVSVAQAIARGGR
jgi:very-short-patch-repair endonuclease